jgi:precorrin-3B C17-methyltransferase
MSGCLFVVGLGPGDPALLTGQARAALAATEAVVGYGAYLEPLAELLVGKTLLAGALGEETARAEQAVDLALAGQRVALVSGGDAGVYGMAAPAFEALERRQAAGQPIPEVEVVAGVSAALAAAALLGAPLGADFAVISLSDLLTPWALIERRVGLAAAADFVIALYNPASSRRTWQFGRARELIAAHRAPSTPVGLVQRAFRPTQRVVLTDLARIGAEAIDMSSIVLVGSSATRRFGDWLVTPRSAGPYGKLARV